MVFILSNLGFFKEKNFNSELRKIEYNWCKYLRDAHSFGSTSKAAKFIENNELNGFVWNPVAEEPIRNIYKVLRRKEYVNYNSEIQHEVLEWYVEKVKMESKTDLKFLKGEKYSDCYSLDEAEEICSNRNQKMLEELQQKMKKYTENI